MQIQETSTFAISIADDMYVQGSASNRILTTTPRFDEMAKVGCSKLRQPSEWLLSNAAGYMMHRTARAIVGRVLCAEKCLVLRCAGSEVVLEQNNSEGNSC